MIIASHSAWPVNFKLKPAGGAALRIRWSLGGYKSDGKFFLLPLLNTEVRFLNIEVDIPTRKLNYMNIILNIINTSEHLFRYCK